MLRTASVVLSLFLVAACDSLAVSTDPTGAGQPFRIEQPSLTLNYAVRINGPTDDLGEVGLFGANFAPRNWALAEGQLLPVSSYPLLFEKLGDAFGGDGVETFALPDLRGRVPMGSSPALQVGDRFGSEQTTLGFVPEHDHAFASPGMSTESTGMTASHSNLQPSLVLTPIIATTGVFPSQNLSTSGDGPANLSSGFGDPFLGEVTWIAHDEIPLGWARADGSLVDIASNPALFSILGVKYGGNGQQNFALPDLRGRVAVGTGQAAGLTNRLAGDTFGEPTENITQAQMPSHTHTVPNTAGGSTLATPGAPPSPQSNLQPSLALTHLVPLFGSFPSRNLSEGEGEAEPGDGPAELGSGTEPLLASISLFAGDYTIQGHTMAHGQELSISQYTALFALFGTIYGGDGRVDFGLPDLRGRAAVGAGRGPGLSFRRLGDELGVEESTLSVGNLPAHTHELSFLPGDYNADGTVDIADYTVWRDAIGMPSTQLANNVHSTTVGGAEYETWRNYFGQSLPAGASAPEPASVVGLTLLLGGIPVRRRSFPQA